VAVEELILGDNDKLSALVATLINADLLILASDIDGVFDKNPHLNADAKLVPEITDLASVRSFIEEKTSKLGTGGMTSKIQAAEICLAKNIEMYIVNGSKNNFIADALSGKALKTRFVPIAKS
jgi:glutamate 5-kinase